MLGLSVHDALDRFAGRAPVAAALRPVDQVGLGYLRLGEPTPSLSGGEWQRLRIASRLRSSQRGALYVFDEPSTGLLPCARTRRHARPRDELSIARALGCCASSGLPRRVREVCVVSRVVLAVQVLPPLMIVSRYARYCGLLITVANPVAGVTKSRVAWPDSGAAGALGPGGAAVACSVQPPAESSR